MYFGHMQYDIDNRHYIYDGYYTNATAQHKFVYKFLILIKIDSSCYNWWMIFFSNNCCRFNHHFSKKNCKIERVDAFCICKAINKAIFWIMFRARCETFSSLKKKTPKAAKQVHSCALKPKQTTQFSEHFSCFFEDILTHPIFSFTYKLFSKTCNIDPYLTTDWNVILKCFSLNLKNSISWISHFICFRWILVSIRKSNLGLLVKKKLGSADRA